MFVCYSSHTQSAVTQHLSPSSVYVPFSPSDLNEDPEWRERNPLPGCVDIDRDYQIFLLHIQPAPPPAILHQMGQVEMPLTVAGMNWTCLYHVWHCVWACCRRSGDFTAGTLPTLGLDRLFIRKLCGRLCIKYRLAWVTCVRLLAPH